jgi:hypothetical protein
VIQCSNKFGTPSVAEWNIVSDQCADQRSRPLIGPVQYGNFVERNLFGHLFPNRLDDMPILFPLVLKGSDLHWMFRSTKRLDLLWKPIDILPDDPLGKINDLLSRPKIRIKDNSFCVLIIFRKLQQSSRRFAPRNFNRLLRSTPTINNCISGAANIFTMLILESY